MPQENTTILTNLAKLRGHVVNALRYAEEGSADANPFDLIAEHLSETLILLHLVEAEYTGQQAPSKIVSIFNRSE